MARVARLAVLLGLLLAPGLLPVRPAPAEAPAKKEPAAKGSLRDYAAKSQARHAYGLYLKKVKIGWQVEEVKLGKHAGKDVLISTSEMYTAVTYDGEKSVSTEKTTVCFELEGEGAILYAEMRSKENKKETVRRAVRKGKGMVLTMHQGARKSERAIPLPKETLSGHRAFEDWLRSGPAKGAKFTRWTASWDEDDVDVPEAYTYKHKTTVLWGGVKTEVHVAQAVIQKARFEAQLLADGTPFLAQVGGLLTLRMEKEVVAKKVDGGDVDLMAASSIVIDRALGLARHVEKLTLELSGLDDFELPQSHRQRVRKEKKGTFVDLRRDHRTGKAVPLSKEERAAHVKATPKVQSDHEAIRGLAKKIVGKEEGPVKVAELLAKWVYKNVRKTYAENADNALAVLDSKAGDCTEHTLLFVALARAVNLPAREVGGLAYVHAGKPMFGWHAWAEVHDGSQWVSVDPTWDQVYVDGTHIKFSEGADDLAWINVAGKLKIKVVKVETKK
jgi:hypothetical protein